MTNTETLVTVEFTEKGKGCEMIFTHSKFPDEAAKKNHNEGWVSSFRKLDSLLA